MSGHLSRRDVLEYLRLHGPSTAAEIATHYDVSERVAGAVVGGAFLGGVIEHAGEYRGGRTLYRLPRATQEQPAEPAAQAEGGC